MQKKKKKIPRNKQTNNLPPKPINVLQMISDVQTRFAQSLSNKFAFEILYHK